MRFAHFQFDPKTDRLGEGPSSEVFKATDTRLGRTVALKILRPHVEFDPQARERFEREAKHTSNLVHPNIATIYEYGEDRGTSYIAMEYLDGRTMDKILKDHRLDYEEGMRIATQVFAAVKLVHQRGLVHRDLKPGNIMVMDDGQVKLLDFGICRSNQDSNITQEGMLVGTVLYMSPEQVLGEEIDYRTDVFALGSVFFHAFTGELPFPGKSFPEVCLSILEADPRKPSKIRSGFHQPLEAFLLRCLARDKLERYPNGAAAYAALMAVSDNLKMRSTKARPTVVQGRIWIPPFTVGSFGNGGEGGNGHDFDHLFAGGLRRDLFSELVRSTNLDVELSEGSESPPDLKDAYVLRGALEIEGDRGALEYVLERAVADQSETRHIYKERIEHEDPDEWGLQAKLVGSLARAVKRRLAEYSLAPPPEERGDPGKALNLTHRAHELLHRGTTRHLMGAISIFREALREDPGCTLAHAGLAEAFARKFVYWDGEVTFLQEAHESAQRALTLDPFSAEAHTSLGFAHLVSGDVQEGERELKLSIQIDHEEWLAHRLLGALLHRQGNYEGSSPLLQRAIVLRPTHIGSYDHLYGVLCRLDRYQEAIEVADRGIAMAKKHLEEVPDDQEARLHLGLLLGRMGLSEDAKKTVEEARKRAPKDAYTNFHSACVLALLGEGDSAIELLKEAQARGFYLQSEAERNTDLEILRSRPEYQILLG